MRGMSSRSRVARITARVASMSQRASCASAEIPSRYMASVTAGYTDTSGSRMVRLASTHARWCRSERSRRATSGPASTRTPATRALRQQGREAPAGLRGQIHPPAVEAADVVRDGVVQRRTRTRRLLFLCERTDRLAQDLGLRDRKSV